MATDTLRRRRRRNGEPNYRIIRYADDFVVMVSDTKAHAEELKGEVAAVLSPMGLRLSEVKTTIVHIDEGFDFLGHADLRVMPTLGEVCLWGAAIGPVGSA